MYNAGLILEGGGMRGVYTTGVLDFFWISKLNLHPATVFRREPAMRAVICLSREDVLSALTWIF